MTARMIRLLSLLLLLCCALPAQAQSRADMPHMRAELLADATPDGAIRLGLRLTPKPGWHTYWVNPGGAGAALTTRWTLPAGVTVSDWRYPAPELFSASGIVNHVLPAPALLTARLGLPSAADRRQALNLSATFDWLVCDDRLCVPERATLSLAFAPVTLAAARTAADAFAAADATQPLDVAWPARYARAGNNVRLSVAMADPAKVRAVHLFPEAGGIIDPPSAQRFAATGDRLLIETRAGWESAPAALPAVLRLEIAGRAAPLAVHLTATPGNVSPLPAPQPPVALWTILLAAVAGGLILNLMPCVFPILGLKALSLARGGMSERIARREAVAYALGVILTCLALGGAILALRAAGEQVGWAFQLQSPPVIAALLLLMVAIALNLSGLFEIRMGSGMGQSLAERGGVAGAFWTGALAAFVATPCTGPFMGLALGAALFLSPLPAMAVFGGLGLGIALPFLLIGFVPALRRRLPKPGGWMATCRRLMALPLWLTALALVWVLGRQAGMTAVAIGLGGALALGLLLWWIGRCQTRGRVAASAPYAALALAMAAIALVARIPTQATAPAEASHALPDTEDFSEARLASLRAVGKPVFVYFTADWCITCKVNEKGALASPRVAEAFQRAGVRVLVGDWTNGNPAIGRFLTAQGRAGVPLYLMYHPDGRIETLSQILTPDALIAASTGLRPS